MSRYTTEVRYICEMAAGLTESAGFNKVEEILEKSREKIFDFDFPIYDEAYRPILEKKILRHYYTREIGAETVGLWKLWLNTRLNEIMPYYNQLYESTLIRFDPLKDSDSTVTRQGTTSGNKEDNTNSRNETETNTTNTSSRTDETNISTNESGTTSDASNHWNYYSDTPQGGITGLESKQYLTNASNDTDARNGTTSGQSSQETNATQNTENELNSEISQTGNTKMTSEFANTEDYIEHITGKRGVDSYSKMLQDFRNTFLNIDMRIIESLEDLFMQLW